VRTLRPRGGDGDADAPLGDTVRVHEYVDTRLALPSRDCDPWAPALDPLDPPLAPRWPCCFDSLPSALLARSTAPFRWPLGASMGRPTRTHGSSALPTVAASLTASLSASCACTACCAGGARCSSPGLQRSLRLLFTTPFAPSVCSSSSLDHALCGCRCHACMHVECTRVALHRSGNWRNGLLAAHGYEAALQSRLTPEHRNTHL
jgi:hypothetical protein